METAIVLTKGVFFRRGWMIKIHNNYLKELEEFAQWAQTLQLKSLKIMELHNIVIDDLNDPMQKLAFTFYSELCEIEQKARRILEEY